MNVLQAVSSAHRLDGSIAEWMWLIPIIPLVGALVTGALAIARATRRAPSADGHSGTDAQTAVLVPGAIGSAAVFLSFVLTALIFATMLRTASAGELAEPFVRRFGTWMTVGSWQLSWGLQLDQLSVMMALVITGVGSLIHLFSIGYMRGDPAGARYFAYLNLFVSAMLVLVLGSSYPVMFVGWEGVGLASYLLIGFWFGDVKNANAGRKAFIVNRIGDVGFLLAMFLLFRATGTLDFVDVHSQVASLAPPLIVAVALFLFLGCAGKSAQLPLYIWLPDAMAGPTPVSALIHAATMVTAGVYLVARAASIFALAPAVSLFIAVIGAVTALFAATVALRQWDIKKVLAYSTISQLGYMFVAVGVGAYSAGLFHLVTHAFFKALLFLGAGAVIHAMHHALEAADEHTTDAQDLRNMGGLRRAMPATAIMMGLATLAIAGIPPLAGFFSKDEILGAVFARAQNSPLALVQVGGVSGASILYVVYALSLLSALLTAVYMMRMLLLAFGGAHRAGAVAEKALHDAPWVMLAPMLVLTILTVVGGWLNLPEIVPLGAHHLLSDWLAPVTGTASVTLGGQTELQHSTELVLIGIAVAVSVLGLVVAWLRYGKQTAATLAASDESGIRGLLADAYRVDAGLDRVVVRPLQAFSVRVLWRGIDQRLDRALVVGGRLLGRLSGEAADAVADGDAGRYAWVLTIGAVVLIAAISLGWP